MSKFIVLLSSILILSSCGIPGSFRDEPVFESLAGILTEQSYQSEMRGTHVLVDDFGEETALRSLTINLSTSQYLKNKVEVTGILNPEDEVFEVRGITVLEVLSEDTELKKYIVYKNVDLGFQLKYYDNWDIEEGMTGLVFLAPSSGTDMDKILIDQFQFDYSPTSYEDGTTDTSLSAYFEQNFPEIEGLNNLKRKIGIDKVDAVKLESEDGKIDYYLYRNGLIYKISFVPASKDSVMENKNIFNRMLSEFRFIGFSVEDSGEPGEPGLGLGLGLEPESEPETEPESGSEGYDLPELDMELTYFESLPFHFRGIYPANWYYAGSRSDQSDILHHYGFSDESVTDENEIISLDLFSGELPGGSSLFSSGLDGIRTVSGSDVNIYVDVNGRIYKFTADSEYEDLAIVMAAGIESIATEED